MQDKNGSVDDTVRHQQERDLKHPLGSGSGKAVGVQAETREAMARAIERVRSQFNRIRPGRVR